MQWNELASSDSVHRATAPRLTLNFTSNVTTPIAATPYLQLSFAGEQQTVQLDEVVLPGEDSRDFVVDFGKMLPRFQAQLAGSLQIVATLHAEGKDVGTAYTEPMFFHPDDDQLVMYGLTRRNEEFRRGDFTHRLPDSVVKDPLVLHIGELDERR